MASAALAIDVDGTLEPSDAAQVARLTKAAAARGVPVHINTARDARYCARPDAVTTSIAAPERHHCLNHPDPPSSKVVNMRTIRAAAGVRDKRCVILIDDRPENNEAVRHAGYSAVQVDARRGIDREAVDRAILALDRCSRPRRPVGIYLAAIGVVLAGLVLTGRCR